MLGTNTGHYPRHARKYADFAALEEELQAKRVDAFRAFAAEVETGAYPAPNHEVHMDPANLEDFTKRAQTI